MILVLRILLMEIKWKCDYLNSIESQITIDMKPDIPDSFYKLDYNIFNEISDYNIFIEQKRVKYEDCSNND